MKKITVLTSALMAAALFVCSATAVSAATITETESAQASQTITITKENAAPSFTVEIPASVTLSSGEPQKIAYSISEEDLTNIPEGKKVAITLADAGYKGKTGTFGLYNAATGEVATYGLYGSVYSLREPYELGGKGYVSFYGNETPVDGKYTMTRAIKVSNFDTLQGGTYTGYITYNIALINQ